MKRLLRIILPVSMILVQAASALAVDMDALDRVSVLMPKSEVVSILGHPDKSMQMTTGWKMDLYNLNHSHLLVGAGHIYETERHLAGHALIFQGNVARPTAARLQELGFILLEEKDSAFRLTGKDDDAGHPIVVTIGEKGDLTTVITFEKGFYDRRMIE